MRGDTRSLIHGIINLIVPFFIYDLASLLVGAITAANYNPWLAFWPMTLLLWLPFLSDAVCVVVAAVRFQRRGRTRALLGLIFSVGAAALYYMLRFQLHFTLSRRRCCQRPRYPRRGQGEPRRLRPGVHRLVQDPLYRRSAREGHLRPGP